MTKSFKKLHIITISLILAVICGAFYCLTYYQKPTQTQIATRNIEVSRNAIDCQSIFDSFEDSKLEIVDNVTNFEGVKTFNLTDFEELDLLSDTDADETVEMKVKYAYTYDSETNLITLTVTEISGEEIEIIDTLVGVAFVNENGNLDAVFDCDGDYILLSELQELEQIQNCGWFKKALKKVAKAVKKVCNTTVGVVGAVATIAVPAVIGVVCAVAAAPVVATIAVGAVVGAGIAAGTAAASTYIQDGEVDWETVGICAGVGAAVGALASGVAYGITSAITGGSSATMTGTEKVSNGTGYKSFDAFKKANGPAGENQAWHHIVEQHSDNIAKFGAENIHNTGNLVNIPSGYQGSLHSKVTGFYNSLQPNVTNSTSMTIRQWLSTQSFDAQYKFGVDTLLQFAKELGITVILP